MKTKKELFNELQEGFRKRRMQKMQLCNMTTNTQTNEHSGNYFGIDTGGSVPDTK
jgi:hypothetical protein